MACVRVHTDVHIHTMAPERLPSSLLHNHAARRPQRRLDVKGSGSELLTAALPESIQAVDEGSLGRMLEAAEGAVKALKSERLRQLLMLATSPR